MIQSSFGVTESSFGVTENSPLHRLIKAPSILWIKLFSLSIKTSTNNMINLVRTFLLSRKLQPQQLTIF